MKTILLAVVLFGFSFGMVRADDPSFIVVTIQTQWNDGVTSPVGEVERAWSSTENGYLVKFAGRNYIIPLANARPISATDAAIALIARREEMDRELELLDAQVSALQGKTATKAAPTQRNGRPLPPNWIDPDEADRRFQAQQLQQQLQRQQADIQRLQQQRR